MLGVGAVFKKMDATAEAVQPWLAPMTVYCVVEIGLGAKGFAVDPLVQEYEVAPDARRTPACSGHIEVDKAVTVGLSIN